MCNECWNDPALTRILDGSVCTKCGVPMPGSIGSTEERVPEKPCGMCSSLPFGALRACGIYSGGLEASILFLKDHPHICPRLCRIICRIFSSHRGALISDIIIPIPLHRARQKQRGFNQASIIARVIAREFGIRLEERALARVKPTERHRAGMDAADRAESVGRAFEVTRRRTVEGSSVLLVDDVHTTGSTVSAASRCLLKAGSTRVVVLTIARV